MKTNKIKFCTRLPKRVLNKLKKYAKENETPLEVIIELSVKQFMNQKRTVP